MSKPWGHDEAIRRRVLKELTSIIEALKRLTDETDNQYSKYIGQKALKQLEKSS